MQKEIKIVYTPLHGTGGMLVKRVLKEIGFENVYIVKEQEEPDGNFPTVDYPNPEEGKAFKLALELAKEVDADIVMANDPDADRLGVYVKDVKTNEYIQFTGNMTGNLIAEYILSQKKSRGELKVNSAVIKTIVSSNLTDAICEHYGVKMFETLTGFKNIAKIIRGFEENNNSYNCLFSYEESYGCIIGTHARDKDGIVAVMMLSEMTAYYKEQNKTLWDQMNDMYKKYGYYKEKNFSIVHKGIEGAEKIKLMMEDMRNNPPKKLGKYNVLSVGDYLTGKIKNNQTGEETSTGMAKSNVLYYYLNDNAWCAVRPSGTEPKIKFYIGVKGESAEDADEKLAEIEKEFSKQKIDENGDYKIIKSPFLFYINSIDKNIILYYNKLKKEKFGEVEMDKDIFIEEEKKLAETIFRIDEEEKQMESRLSTSYNVNDIAKGFVMQMYAKKINDIKKIRTKPYFARMDYKENNRKKESFYIGKISIIDSKTLEPIVVDWRAPIANLYYEGRIGKASYKVLDEEIFGEIFLKRQFIIEERKLKKYVDIDVTGNDVLLENALEEKADDRLKNIVATIQDEQNKIIRAPINKPLIVQGVAGSRKNDYCTSQNSIFNIQL